MKNINRSFSVLVSRFLVLLCAFKFIILEANIFVEADYGNFVRAGIGGEKKELCNADLSSFLPPPYANLSNIICRPIWNTFVLRYSQNEDNVMNIIVSAVYTTGWIGMGFSKDGLMVGSSAMVGWVNKEGEARHKQYYLQGKKKSLVIADQGELPRTGVPSSVVLHGDRLYLAFQLNFNARLAHQHLIFAFGFSNPKHSHLSLHKDKTSLRFDFSAGSATSAPSNIAEMKRNHGILGLIGWGLILPLGAIIPRYFRHKDPLWFYLHSVIQFLGFVIGLAGVILGKQLYDKIEAHFPTHRGIGIFVLVLSIIQVLAFFLRPSKEAKIRRYWNWYHHWFGRIALFFGALNIVLGIKIGSAGNDWKIGYGFVVGVVLLSVIVLEVVKWMKRSDKTTIPSTFQMNPVQFNE